MDWLKKLIATVLADPTLAEKIRNLYAAIMAFKADLPEAAAVDYAEFDAAVAEVVGDKPEALGDGIAILRKLYALIQAHPELIGLVNVLISLLA